MSYETAMNLKKIFLSIMLVILILNMTGCFGVNSSFRRIRNHIFDNMSIDYKKEFEFSVGPAGLLLAGMVVRFAETEEPIDDIIGEISRVQVGVYNNIDNDSEFGNFESLIRLTNLMADADWECIVRSKSSREITAVFVKYDEDILNQLFVVAMDKREMVLVEVHGDLGKVIEIAIREKGLKFEMANH